MSSKALDELKVKTFMDAITNPVEDLTPLEVNDKQPLVDKFERCSFCNTKLMFSHELNLGNFELIETNRCPGCGVTSQPKSHTLQ